MNPDLRDSLDPDDIERRASAAGQLASAEYPLRRDDLLTAARAGGGDDDLVARISLLPRSMWFKSFQEVWAAIAGGVARGRAPETRGMEGLVMAMDRPTVVERLEEDHRHVEEMLGSLDEIPLSELGEYFCKLREELVRHEVAEELIVYPEFRKRVPGGDAIADARIAEQAEAEESLARLEKEETATEAFRRQLQDLKAAVLDHAQAEEQKVFLAMRTEMGEDELRQMGDRYARAVASAPTHPHPHAPDKPPGNVILGPVAALADRIRDAIRGAA